MLVFSVTLMISCRADAEISVVFVFCVVLVIAAALMFAPAGRADAEVLPAGNPEEMLNRLVSMSLNFGMRRRDKGGRHTLQGREGRRRRVPRNASSPVI